MKKRALALLILMVASYLMYLTLWSNELSSDKNSTKPTTTGQLSEGMFVSHTVDHRRFLEDRKTGVRQPEIRHSRTSVSGSICVGDSDTDLKPYEGEGIVDFVLWSESEQRVERVPIDDGRWSVGFSQSDSPSELALYPQHLELDGRVARVLGSDKVDLAQDPPTIRAVWVRRVLLHVQDDHSGEELSPVSVVRCQNRFSRVVKSLVDRTALESLRNVHGEGASILSANTDLDYMVSAGAHQPRFATDCDPAVRGLSSPVVLEAGLESAPVWVSAPGYAWSRWVIRPGGNGAEEHWLKLKKAGDLEVSVIDIQDEDDPLYVRLYPTRSSDNLYLPIFEEQLKEAQAEVFVHDLPTGHYRVHLERGRRFSSAAVVANVEAGVEPGRATRVELSARGRPLTAVRGCIMVAADLDVQLLQTVTARRLGDYRLKPLPALRASLHTWRQDSTRPVECNYSWELNDLSEGTYRVVVEPLLYSQVIRVPTADDVIIDLRSVRPRIVRFEDADLGALVQVDRVSFAYANAREENPCEFCPRRYVSSPENPMLRDIPNGELVVEVRAEGYGRSTHRFTIGDDDEDVVVKLGQVASVVVELVDREGKTVEPDGVEWLRGLAFHDEEGEPLVVQGLQSTTKGSGFTNTAYLRHFGVVTISQDEEAVGPLFEPASIAIQPGSQLTVELLVKD